MTATQAASLVGSLGSLRVDCSVGVLRFDVTVSDVRTTFGRTDYLVKPVRGTSVGATWVSADRVSLSEGGAS